MPFKDKEKRKAYNLAHREQQRDYDRLRYHARKEEEKARRNNYRHTHLEDQRAYDRAHYQAHREEIKAKSKRYRLAHRDQVNVASRTYRAAMLVEAMRFLGSTCGCPGCGVSELRFLTIDHIHGRNTKKRGHVSLLEAKASGWDKTQFQILCANCNFAKRDRGFCPVHQTAPGQSNGHRPGANAQLSL